jgi:tetratricopeptide (TPR) repeat protein
MRESPCNVMQRVLLHSAGTLLFAACSALGQAPAATPGLAGPPPVQPSAGPIVQGKRALAAKQFLEARRIFAAILKDNPTSIDAQLGVADAELGLHQYQAAERDYRKITSAQPELWQAHKNLVIVEAALGRWEDFNRERAVLRLARERGAPGISARESDIIDSFTVRGQRWIVREYFEPVGRTQTRYNFEHFSPDGKAEAYISLESEQAARAVTPGGAVSIGNDVNIGKDTPAPPADHFALNWYTGKAHGTIATYPTAEPSYETTRAAVINWLRTSATSGHP